jgi:hypothetical protein
MNISCKHCERTIELVNDTWVNPNAIGDDAIWREACEANHEDRVAAHEPGSDQILDIWLRFDAPDDEQSSHEANTFFEDGRYYVAWYHTAVGLVTRKYVDTYAEAKSFLEANGYQDFTS